MITPEMLAEEQIALKNDSELYLECLNDKLLKDRAGEVEIRDGGILFWLVYKHIRNNKDKAIKKKLFIEQYAANMKAHSDKNPGMYLIPGSSLAANFFPNSPKTWEALAEKMFNSVLNNTANISEVLKKTVKKNGGKPTNAGVKEFINNLN